ncbi:MAG: FMN-binding protein [Oscillospiraceae bacterium]
MSNKQETTFGIFVKPILVLFLLTSIVAVMLSFINQVTTPIINANIKKTQDLARSEVLEKADSFEELSVTSALKEKTSVTEVYKASNDSGYVMTFDMKGYAGILPIIIGVNNDGSINKIKVLPNEETPGIGKKVEANDFTSLFESKTSSTISDVSKIAGATFSSTATIDAVTNSFTVFETVTGGQ